MVKPVDKKLYKNYLQKAEEMLEMAQYALGESKNNAAVMASIHCSISAMDALAVFYLGKRHSGIHEQALDSVNGALSETEFKEIAKQFGGLIELKNQAEYQPDLMGERQAADAVSRASRILSRIKQKLE
jgi:HEPN domain-containing protein